MNLEIEEEKAGKVLDKMERALKYFKRRKNALPRRVRSLPERGSRRVILKIKKQQLIG